MAKRAHTTGIVLGLAVGMVVAAVGFTSLSSRPQAFFLPPAPSSLGLGPATQPDLAASSAVPRPQASSVSAPASVAVAAVAVALSVGLASRHPATRPGRHCRIVMAAESKDSEGQDAEALLGDDFDEEEEDEFFDEDDEDEFYDEGEEEEVETAVCRANRLKGSHHKYLRVLYQIRGRSYREALMLLEFMPWRACKPVLNALQSAAANAQNQKNMDKSRLYIKDASAYPRGAEKRFRMDSKSQPKMFMRKTTDVLIRVAEMSDAQLVQLDF